MSTGVRFSRLSLLIVSLVLATNGDDFDIEEFAFDIFGDRSAVHHIKNTPSLTSSDIQHGSCIDYSNSCAKYAKYCDSSDVVKRFCKITCRLCSKKQPNPTRPCEDNKRAMCAARKSMDFCRLRKDYMSKNCPKTCGFCKPTDSCQDKKPVSYCKYILDYGYCTRPNTRKLATIYCKKTCDFCKEKPQTCGIVRAKNLHGTGGIIGGVAATKGFWPWQVAIYYKDEFICGGTLVERDIVISAAHCFNFRSTNPTYYKVIVGEHNRDYKEGTEQYLPLKKIIVHKAYNDIYDDIAMLHLTSKAQLNTFVEPACMPKAGSQIQPGTICYMTGWGKVFHPGYSVPALRQAKVPVVSLSECQRKNNDRRSKVTDKMICAGERGTFKSGCHGDSGGPFVCKNSDGKWVLQGIMSWGSSDCNALEKYTVFTKVSAYISWIQKHMA